MNLKKMVLACVLGLISQFTSANVVSVSIDGIASMYPLVDTMVLSFDDSIGATVAPYWLNGFASGYATIGYTGTLHSNVSGYQAPVYVGFTPDNYFNFFQECSLTAKCYLAFAGPTGLLPSTVDPRIAGNLAAFFQENLQNLLTIAAPGAGWNVSYNSPPNFQETWPWLQVVSPSKITVSSVSEPSILLSFLFGVFLIVVLQRRTHTGRSTMLGIEAQ